MQVLVAVAEQRLAEYRDQLSEKEKSRYDLEQQLTSFKTELASLARISTEPAKAKPHVLEHLPTPMARTVFGGEIHFRLLGHRLTYVPWEEMIERLKTDARNHISKLKDSPRIELSLPEIAGFGAHYILRRAETHIETRAGTATHSGVELELIYLVDAEQNLALRWNKPWPAGPNSAHNWPRASRKAQPSLFGSIPTASTTSTRSKPNSSSSDSCAQPDPCQWASR